MGLIARFGYIRIENIQNRMQHAVVGPKKDQGFGAVVGIVVVEYQGLAVQHVTGNDRSVFRAIPVRILIQHIGATDVIDHLVSSGDGIAVYGNLGRITKHHGSQIGVIVGKPVCRID